MRIQLIFSAAVFILFAPTAAAQHQSHTPATTQSSAPAATAAEAEAPPPQPTEPLPPSETPATDSATEPMLTPMPSEMSAMDHQMSSMQGVLGPYPMSREASGTSWQPDTSEHMGQMFERGEWTLMGHVMLNGVYDWQDGPRGDEKAFVSGMLMGSARRDVGANGRLNLRVMLSPDPFMGRDGYPLLLASGETADGVTPLVDRQHPHELFMELSGSYSYRLSARDSAFVYLGYPGEPAFGPPAFMHRLSALDSPEAPITHHWFDSTHITFGVLTAGYTRGDWRIEASQFTGREPDEDRYDFDEPQFDSTSVRLSWNPTERLALQASWADLESPEQLEPEIDETRWSLSAIYTMPLGEESWWSTTVAYGAKDPTDENALTGLAIETAYRPNRDWTFFGRAEQVESHDLAPGEVYTVAKASLGALRDFRIRDNVTVGVGALYSHNFVPDELEPSYDGDQDGAMAFVRLRIG